MFGLNILAQFVDDRQRLLQHLERSKPRSVVVMDDLGFAQAVRKASPFTTVIYRSYHPHDHEWHMKISPADWLQQHRGFAVNGIVVQALNEPQGYGDLAPLVRWCVELMERAANAGVRLCLPNFAVGHPKEDFGAELDDLLSAFARFSQHVLGVHEYAQQSMRDEQTYRIGRFVSLLERSDALGLRRPQVIVTEHGRDVGGGENDGWLGIGLSEEAYWSFLRECEDLYRKYGASAAIFCYGGGGGDRWRTFDVEHAGTLLNRVEDYNRSFPMTMPNYGTKIERGVARMLDGGTGTKATAVHVRQLPVSNALSFGTLKEGSVAAYWDTPQTSDGKSWWQVQLEDGRIGFMSALWVRWEPAPIEEQPTTPPPHSVVITFPGSQEAAFNIWKSMKQVEIGAGNFARIWAEAFELDTEGVEI